MTEAKRSLEKGDDIDYGWCRSGSPENDVFDVSNDPDSAHSCPDADYDPDDAADYCASEDERFPD